VNGMTVLDLGSGAGDVAMLVAELVCPMGKVVGVDMNPAILETARRRAKVAGHRNITYFAGDLREVVVADDFDAVVGRGILMCLNDPLTVLRHLLPHLRSGGVVAFFEVDFTVPGMAYPPSHIDQQLYDWITRAVPFAGVEGAMGMQLHQLFVAAGLTAPQMLTTAMMGGSNAFVEDYTTYWAGTVRSLLPLLIKSRMATEEEICIETLARRYRDEVVQQGSVLRSYLWMGAWARKAQEGNG
jgi:ubiquinone/menaquinone biosynthesis C-methylase UbiE